MPASSIGASRRSRMPRPTLPLPGAFPRLWAFAIEHLLLLPLGAAIALVWVNTSPESYYEFVYAVGFAVNDVAMVFFFALMTKEVVEATAPDGVLHPWRRALLPVIAAIGGTAVAALIHVRLVEVLDEPALAIAWPVALGTDVAVSYFVARIIFRRELIPFVLVIAFASDALGFLAIAVFQPAADLHPGAAALVMAGAIAVAIALRLARVKSFWPYVLGAGGLSWYALYRGGLHPALALVPIMPLLPHAARDPGFFVDASPAARDALSRFEIVWRHPAQVSLFFFGLVNAGVPFRALEAGTLGLPIATIVGRPLGLLAGSAAALAAGLHLPHRCGWRDVVVAGFAVAISFSVGLFFCAALLPPGQLRSETSMGVLLTLAGAPLALVAARLLGVGRFAR